MTLSADSIAPYFVQGIGLAIVLIAVATLYKKVRDDQPTVKTSQVFACSMIAIFGLLVMANGHGYELNLIGASVKTYANEARRNAGEAKENAEYSALQAELQTQLTTALAGDRASFDRLHQLANDPDFKLRDQAKKLFGLVKQQLDVPAGDLSAWEGMDLHPQSMLELRELYTTATLAQKIALIHVAEETTGTKREKLQFFVDIMKSDDNIHAVRNAIYQFCLYTKQGFDVTDAAGCAAWWESHRNEITN